MDEDVYAELARLKAENDRLRSAGKDENAQRMNAELRRIASHASQEGQTYRNLLSNPDSNAPGELTDTSREAAALLMGDMGLV